MPCVLVLRRHLRETHVGPDNRRGHVIDVLHAIAPLKGVRTRTVHAIIDLPDMGVPEATALFVEKDWEEYTGPPDPDRGGHHEAPVRQRSVRLDVDVLRPLLTVPKRPKLTAMFQTPFYVDDDDRITVQFDTLRQGFIVDRDLTLEIKSDGTIGPK